MCLEKNKHNEKNLMRVDAAALTRLLGRLRELLDLDAAPLRVVRAYDAHIVHRRHDAELVRCRRRPILEVLLTRLLADGAHNRGPWS